MYIYIYMHAYMPYAIYIYIYTSSSYDIQQSLLSQVKLHFGIHGYSRNISGKLEKPLIFGMVNPSTIPRVNCPPPDALAVRR